MREELHLPTQASEHVIPFLDFVPNWFIDCGPANAAEYLCMRDEWPEINMIGLEPSPVGFEEASKYFPIDSKSLLLNVAVWENDQRLALNNPNDLLHSTFRQERASPDWIEVGARSLDSLDIQFGPFDDSLLWIDIEGSEELALLGAEKLLGRRAIRAINIEVNYSTECQLSGLLTQCGFYRRRTYFDQGHGGSRDELWILGAD